MKNIIVVSILFALWVPTVWGNCSEVGRFRVDQDPTCRKYYDCTINYFGLFVKTNGECLAPTKFNPTTNLCDANAICIDSICLNELPNKLLSDPNATNSSTYIQCTGVVNQYPLVKICPTPQIFYRPMAQCMDLASIPIV